MLHLISHANRCECCSVEAFVEVAVPLTCDDGSLEEVMIKNPTTCKCNMCGAPSQ